MKTIYLKEGQGNKVAVEVSDEVAEQYRESLRAEWRNDAYENYYNVSLENVMDLGLDFADEQPNADELLVENYERGKRKILLKRIKAVLPQLTELQRQTLHKLFVLNMLQAEIAKEEGISRSAIKYRVDGIFTKIKKFLNKI